MQPFIVDLRFDGFFDPWPKLACLSDIFKRPFNVFALLHLKAPTKPIFYLTILNNNYNTVKIFHLYYFSKIYLYLYNLYKK